MSLLINESSQCEFFVPDIFDTLGASFKNDIASMEHPIFTLSKKIDLRNLEYEKGDVKITIKPNTDGLPTIFDKDILLYCISIMMNEINAGRTPPRTLRISCHDLLKTTNRATNDNGYRLLKKALDRLKGVSIKTNIKTNKHEQTSAFGIIDRYDIVESNKVKNRMVRLEITLAKWFYNSAIGKEVLTIHPDYFRLGKPIERRLYEIARKHCGKSHQWEIKLDKLLLKIGSTGSLRLFRSRLKKIALDNNLPDYCFSIDGNDKVLFYQKHNNAEKNTSSKEINFNIFDIRPNTLKYARTLLINTGFDINTIMDQWITYMNTKEPPANKNGSFIGFVKHKIKQQTY
jgi:hypothetical protein